MHLRRRHTSLALLGFVLWAAHLGVAVWHGASGEHRACAPDGKPLPSVQAAHVPCPADDALGGGLPAVPAPTLAAELAEQPLPATPVVALPARSTDVLAFAPKNSPPPRA